MSLSNAYVQSPKKIPEVLNKIRDGQAPDRLTIQLLKDWGFKSTNDRPFIALLKSLGFLSDDGAPTQRYHDYRDHSRSKSVLAEAIHEAYADLLLISATPTASDKAAIQGKFKSFHNTSDNVSSMMTNTFYQLLDLADFSSSTSAMAPPQGTENVEKVQSEMESPKATSAIPAVSGLHYNIQIHLPATKDLEVYNAIFRSLKENLIE